MNEYENYILNIANNGGPSKEDYSQVLLAFNEIGKSITKNNFSLDELKSYWSQYGEAFIQNTLQSHVITKPYGYAGDFEIIDKIYTRWTSSNDFLKNWDLFFQAQKAPEAVRARKEYFKSLVKDRILRMKIDDKFKILNLGCGSSREIYELLNEVTDSFISVDCLDIDFNAIEYSKKLCNDYLSQINFIHKNVIHYNTNEKYDIIWSAGLFDYLDDKTFQYLLKRLTLFTKSNSEIIIGNFSPQNPTRYYMECGYWFLKYRDAEKLLSLANNLHSSGSECSIGSEVEGINLFLQMNMI